MTPSDDIGRIVPTLESIEEEVRLMKLDAQEPSLPGIDEVKGLTIRDWIVSRMREAAAKAPEQGK